MKYIHINLATLTMTLMFAACSEKKVEQAKMQEDQIPVSTMILEKTGHSENIVLTGQFTTDDETYLSFKTGGIIDKLYVRDGDYVNKGQLLASLDLTEIKALNEQAEIAFQKTKRDHQRVLNLYRDSVATLEQLQNTESAMELARQQKLSALFNLEHSGIRALTSGYVLKRLVSQGQVVGPGTPVLLVNGAGNQQWVLRTSLSDKQWASVKVGDKALVDIPALQLTDIEAKVLRRAEMADPYTGTFSIDVLIQSNQVKVAAGMVGKLKLNLSAQNNVWAIPYEALLDANGDEAYVFVTSGDNKAHKVKVTLKSISDQLVLVEKGLENFTQLILKGNAYLKDGSSIIIKNQ